MGGEEIDSRAIAKLARSASRSVYAGWSIPHGRGATGEAAERAIEAQIAATVAGRKPLYFEPWGEELSKAFALAYRSVMPPVVQIHVRDGMLFIYRQERVRRILNADPDFYRNPSDESDLDAIARVSAAGMNGDLLGYGARSMMERPAHVVRIFRGQALLLYYFISTSDRKVAARYAKRRTLDFVEAFGWEDVGYDLEALA